MPEDRENQVGVLRAAPATAVAFTIKELILGVGLGLQVGIWNYFPRNCKYTRYAATFHAGANIALLGAVNHLISLDKTLPEDYYHKKTDGILTQASLFRGNFKAVIRTERLENAWQASQNVSYIANNFRQEPDDNQVKE